MGDEDDDLLRAAEELGIDLSGVRAGGDSAPAADEAEEQEVDEGAAGTTGDTSDEYIADPVAPEAIVGNPEEILAEATETSDDE